MRCQSCGQPLGEFQDPTGKTAANFGTNPDGTPNEQYCVMCFQIGKFTQPDMTVEKMTELSIKFMVENLGFEQSKAELMAGQVLPTLNRWKKVS